MIENASANRGYVDLAADIKAEKNADMAAAVQEIYEVVSYAKKILITCKVQAFTGSDVAEVAKLIAKRLD